MRKFGPYVPLLLATCSLALTSSVKAQSSTTYAYDARGRLTSVADGIGAKSTYVLDSADNRQNVSVQKQFTAAWEAEALPHIIGFQDGNGWAANVSLAPGFLTYGPYTQGVPTGARVGAWRMLIDIQDVPDNSTVAMLDVYDSTAHDILATRTINRHEWAANGAYQVFELPFTLDASRAGHAIELRTYYSGHAYLRVDRIGYY